MRRIENSTRDREPARKVWREPILTEYEVDKLTAADVVVVPDGNTES